MCYSGDRVGRHRPAKAVRRCEPIQLLVRLSVCLFVLRRETHFGDTDEKTDGRRKNGSKPSRDGLDFLMLAYRRLIWPGRGGATHHQQLNVQRRRVDILTRISTPRPPKDTDTAAVLRAEGNQSPGFGSPQLRQTRWREGRPPLGSVGTTWVLVRHIKTHLAAWRLGRVLPAGFMCPRRGSSEKRDGCLGSPASCCWPIS